MVRLFSKVRHENTCTSFLEIRYALCNAKSFFEETLDVAVQKTFTAHDCACYDTYDNTRLWRQVHMVRNNSHRDLRRVGLYRRQNRLSQRQIVCLEVDDGVIVAKKVRSE